MFRRQSRYGVMALGAMGLILSACGQSRPFLLSGDASSVEIGYGNDRRGADAVARQHCAGFERAPRFLEARENIAFYDCVLPSAADRAN